MAGLWAPLAVPQLDRKSAQSGLTSLVAFSKGSQSYATYVQCLKLYVSGILDNLLVMTEGE